MKKKIITALAILMLAMSFFAFPASAATYTLTSSVTNSSGNSCTYLQRGYTYNFKCTLNGTGASITSATLKVSKNGGTSYSTIGTTYTSSNGKCTISYKIPTDCSTKLTYHWTVKYTTGSSYLGTNTSHTIETDGWKYVYWPSSSHSISVADSNASSNVFPTPSSDFVYYVGDKYFFNVKVSGVKINTAYLTVNAPGQSSSTYTGSNYDTYAYCYAPVGNKDGTLNYTWRLTYTNGYTEEFTGEINVKAPSLSAAVALVPASNTGLPAVEAKSAYLGDKVYINAYVKEKSITKATVSVSRPKETSYTEYTATCTEHSASCYFDVGSTNGTLYYRWNITYSNGCTVSYTNSADIKSFEVKNLSITYYVSNRTTEKDTTVYIGDSCDFHVVADGRAITNATLYCQRPNDYLYSYSGTNIVYDKNNNQHVYCKNVNVKSIAGTLEYYWKITYSNGLVIMYYRDNPRQLKITDLKPSSYATKDPASSDNRSLFYVGEKFYFNAYSSKRSIASAVLHIKRHDEGYDKYRTYSSSSGLTYGGVGYSNGYAYCEAYNLDVYNLRSATGRLDYYWTVTYANGASAKTDVQTVTIDPPSVTYGICREKVSSGSTNFPSEAIACKIGDTCYLNFKSDGVAISKAVLNIKKSEQGTYTRYSGTVDNDCAYLKFNVGSEEGYIYCYWDIEYVCGYSASYAKDAPKRLRINQPTVKCIVSYSSNAATSLEYAYVGESVYFTVRAIGGDISSATLCLQRDGGAKEYIDNVTISSGGATSIAECKYAIGGNDADITYSWIITYSNGLKKTYPVENKFPIYESGCYYYNTPIYTYIHGSTYTNQQCNAGEEHEGNYEYKIIGHVVSTSCFILDGGTDANGNKRERYIKMDQVSQNYRGEEIGLFPHVTLPSKTSLSLYDGYHGAPFGSIQPGSTIYQVGTQSINGAVYIQVICNAYKNEDVNKKILLRMGWVKKADIQNYDAPSSIEWPVLGGYGNLTTWLKDKSPLYAFKEGDITINDITLAKNTEVELLGMSGNRFYVSCSLNGETHQGYIEKRSVSSLYTGSVPSSFQDLECCRVYKYIGSTSDWPGIEYDLHCVGTEGIFGVRFNETSSGLYRCIYFSREHRRYEMGWCDPSTIGEMTIPPISELFPSSDTNDYNFTEYTDLIEYAKPCGNGEIEVKIRVPAQSVVKYKIRLKNTDSGSGAIQDSVREDVYAADLNATYSNTLTFKANTKYYSNQYEVVAVCYTYDGKHKYYQIKSDVTSKLYTPTGESPYIYDKVTIPMEFSEIKEPNFSEYAKWFYDSFKVAAKSAGFLAGVSSEVNIFFKVTDGIKDGVMVFVDFPKATNVTQSVITTPEEYPGCSYQLIVETDDVQECYTLSYKESTSGNKYTFANVFLSTPSPVLPF